MRVNKKFFLILSLILVLGGLLTACSDSKASGEKGSEKVIEMNMNSIFASTVPMSVDAYEPWAKLVEEKTEGRVKVNLYFGGTLGASSSVWQDVQGGIYDVGGPAPVPYFYDTELFPLTIAGLPFAFPDIQSPIKVMTKFTEKYGVEANEKALLMGMVPSEAYDLASIKPIKKLEDLKGLKVRVTGKADSDLVKSWGAIPVSMAIEDTYGALEKKTIDATLAPLTSLVSYSFHEVAPNILRIQGASTLLVPVMNRDFYEKLPEDLQELFVTELNPKLAELMGEVSRNLAETSLAKVEELIEGRGEIITPSPEELQKFKAPAKSQWENWVEEANKRGYPGEEILDDFKQLLQEENLPLPY